jgi:hypothetical protein
VESTLIVSYASEAYFLAIRWRRVHYFYGFQSTLISFERLQFDIGEAQEISGERNRGG